MIKKGKGKIIKSAEFNRLKDLLADHNNKQVVEFTGRGYGTIGMIRSCKTFADYQQKRRMYVATHDAKVKSITDLPVGKMAESVESTLSEPKRMTNLEQLERSFEDMKNLMAIVVEDQVRLAIKVAVEAEMSKVQVELTELRRLKDEAKQSNWVSNLQQRLNGIGR